MKLGLITDIHEQNDYLRAALDYLARAEVDKIVVIGDLCEMGDRIEETCRLLSDARVVGVWGNHDFGLSCDPTERARDRYGKLVLDYMESLQGRLQIEDCHFMHIEPWLNPNELADLWYFDGLPKNDAALSRIFATPHRLMFAGHYHCWLLAGPDGIRPWSGEAPIVLPSSERFFIVVGALCEGRFATYDTATGELCPCNLNKLPLQ